MRNILIIMCAGLFLCGCEDKESDKESDAPKHRFDVRFQVEARMDAEQIQEHIWDCIREYDCNYPTVTDLTAEREVAEAAQKQEREDNLFRNISAILGAIEKIAEVLEPEVETTITFPEEGLEWMDSGSIEFNPDYEIEINPESIRWLRWQYSDIDYDKYGD